MQYVVACRIKRSAETPSSSSQAATGFSALLQLLGKVQSFNVVVLPKEQNGWQIPQQVLEWLEDRERYYPVAVFDAVNESGSKDLRCEGEGWWGSMLGTWSWVKVGKLGE
jgi:hypothetical protein